MTINWKKFYGNEIVQHVAIVLTIILLFFGGGVKFLNANATKNANQWLAGDLDRFAGNRNLTFAKEFEPVEKVQKDRLESQHDHIRVRARTHLEIMIYYYSRYYMAVTLTAVAVIGAGATMLLISKKGWEGAGKGVITVFLTLSCLSAYFGTFPALFEQEDNIKENKKLFAIYANMEDRILSYAATGEDTDRNKKDIRTFIHLIDKELATYNKMPVKLDPSSIPDPSNAIKQSINE